MKRLLIVLVAVVAIAGGAEAQVEVLSNGDVGIGTANPTEKLHVEGNSLFDGGVNILNGDVGIGVNTPLQKFHVGGNSLLNGNVTIGVSGTNHVGNELEVNGKIRVVPTSFKQTAIPSPKPAIILGSYDEFCSYFIPPSTFTLFQSTCPAIYGTQPDLYLGTPFNWVYRTYSKNIHYTNLHQSTPWGYVIVGTTRISSVLSNLKNVQTYNYYLVDNENPQEPTTEPMQYGFLAEELQTVFPELVSISNCGNNDNKLAINYTGMVPILTAAINEQQEIIETQQAEIGILQQIVFVQEKDLTELQNVVSLLREAVLKCCKEAGDIPPISRDTTNNNNSLIKQVPVLYQNTPNPFSANTEISCDIPTSFSSAFIYIYNLQGVELMSFPIAQTGYSTVYVYASTLPAGMYLYTLVVDNQIVDTKRMILTK